MQQDSIRECAAEVMQTVPFVMRRIKSRMRKHRQETLGITEFRSLVFIGGHPGCSLSQAADHIGISLPSASRLAERMVKNGFIMRETGKNDRRNIVLSVTKEGRTSLERTRKRSIADISGNLEALSGDELEIVIKALRILRKAFSSSPDMEMKPRVK